MAKKKSVKSAGFSDMKSDLEVRALDALEGYLKKKFPHQGATETWSALPLPKLARKVLQNYYIKTHGSFGVPKTPVPMPRVKHDYYGGLGKPPVINKVVHTRPRLHKSTQV